MTLETIAARSDWGVIGALPEPADPVMLGKQASYAMPTYSVPRNGATVKQIADRDLFLPPDPIADEIDVQTAEEAWKEITGALAGARVHIREIGEDKQNSLTLRTLGKVTGSLSDFASAVLSTDAALLAMQQLQDQFVSDRVKYAMDSIRDQRRTMAMAMEQKLQKEEEAARKQHEMDKKATKGQVISVVFSWVAAAAQIAVGVFKMCTGNPTGVLDIAAGATGIAKALLETIVLTHPDQRAKLQKSIDDLAKAELVLSVVSGVVDIASTARMVSLGRKIVGGVCKGLMEGGEAAKNTVAVTLVRAFREGSDVSMQCGKQLAQHFAETAAEQVGKKMQDLAKLSELVFEKAQGVLSSRFLSGFEKAREVLVKALGQRAVKEMVEESLLMAAEKVAKSNLHEDMVHLIKAEFVKEFESALRWAVLQAVLKATATIASPMVVTKGAESVFEIARGTNEWRGADEHGRIRDLLMEVEMLQFLMNQIKIQLKDLKKGMERDTEEHVRNTEQITKHIQEQIDVRLALADSMQAAGFMA